MHLSDRWAPTMVLQLSLPLTTEKACPQAIELGKVQQKLK